MQLSTSHILFAAIATGSFHMVTASVIPGPYSGTDITGPFQYQALSSHNLNLLEARGGNRPQKTSQGLAEKPEQMTLEDVTVYLGSFKTETVDKVWKDVAGCAHLRDCLPHLPIPNERGYWLERVIYRCLELQHETSKSKEFSLTYQDFQSWLEKQQGETNVRNIHA
ncbi:hypothetical protein BC835DRAFT_870961 [Cytidiella melzeri]|nr:hypothetical protein BC835DRAFT_870961 [Cytidiella melzeri]